VGVQAHARHARLLRPPRRIKERLTNYVNADIKYEQCESPGTNFVKQDRTTLLKFQACGATRLVKL